MLFLQHESSAIAPR